MTLQADPNAGGLRSGTVTIAGKTFAASQSASACGAADVSSQVSVTRGAFTSNFIGTNYIQQVRLTNQGPAILGPVYLVVDGLPMMGRRVSAPPVESFRLRSLLFASLPTEARWFWLRPMALQRDSP